MATKDITDRQVLLAYAEIAAGSMAFADALLQEFTGQPPKVCFRAMERAASRGLIEYGVSLRSGWMTDKGRALLANGA